MPDVRTAIAVALVIPWLMAAPNDYPSQVEAWRKDREARLKADAGWLSVAGLFWLKEGASTFGSAPDSQLVFPAPAPARAGIFHRKGRNVTVQTTAALLQGKPPSPSHVLIDDAEGKEDVLTIGPLSFFVIQRGDRTGIRLRDLNSPYRRNFTGLHWYPIQPAYRVEARFEPRPERTVRIPNIVGTYDDYKANGILVFTLAGREHRIEPVHSSGQLFLIFKDKTANKTTYGAGRFLYADLPVNGKTILDFNKAYNPPCAFTPYATCPLPPKQNQFPIAIPAGELNYGNH